MPSAPRLSASALPSADITQARKLLVPQSTATKAAGALFWEGAAADKSHSPGHQIPMPVEYLISRTPDRLCARSWTRNSAHEAIPDRKVAIIFQWRNRAAYRRVTDL